MKRASLTVLVLALALCAGRSYAVIVFLRNGGRVEGKVTRKDGKLHIEQADGVRHIDRRRKRRREIDHSLWIAGDEIDFDIAVHRDDRLSGAGESAARRRHGVAGSSPLDL